MENIARDRIPGPFGYRYETPPASGEVHPAFMGTGVSFYEMLVRPGRGQDEGVAAAQVYSESLVQSPQGT